MLAAIAKQTGGRVTVGSIDAKLYWFPVSHPSQAVRQMLALKGITYESVRVLPGGQRIHLRLAGFRGGTVPALKLDGRKIEGSTSIARELDAVVPEPRLFPAEPEARRRVEEAERWGDEVFQAVPRRLVRYGLANDVSLRKWLAVTDGKMPMPGVAARVSMPVSRYYARLVNADAEHARHDLAALPGMLDHVDHLVADGVVTTDAPNAATFQIMSTVRSLLGFADLQETVEAHAYATLARELFPDFPAAVIPPFTQRLGIA